MFELQNLLTLNIPIDTVTNSKLRDEVGELEPAEMPAALRKVLGTGKQYGLVAATDVVEAAEEWQWNREGLRAFVGGGAARRGGEHAEHGDRGSVTFVKLWVFGSKVLLKCFSYSSDLRALLAQLSHAIAVHKEPMLSALQADKHRTVHAQVFYPLELSKSMFRERCPTIGLQLPPAGPLLDEDKFYLRRSIGALKFISSKWYSIDRWIDRGAV